jgi:asparagine synthase (glutamine-hydrolysing)
MCGICGILNFNGEPAPESSIKKMMRAIKHRGPDDEGMYLNGNIGLGFVRLSIIDLSKTSHQPMFDESGRFILIFNGEIYNYLEIKEELLSKGYKFKSTGDAEVLLNSYIEWGKDCLNRFNGMFAFVIFDSVEKKLFAARDRFGVKPFYYYINNDTFIFSSEICAILDVSKEKVVQNDEAFFDYFIYNRTDQTENTFFKNIKKLQHGCHIEIINNNFSINKWYDLIDNLGKPFENTDEFTELLSSSIGLRLRSDVPVGVCFSGGLDSSAIVSLLLNDFNKKDINTFSAIYKSEGHRYDESEFISEYKNLLNFMHFISPSADSLMFDLNKFVKAHNEPVTSTSNYAQFKVMELAKSNVIVTLDGQGADELLAGYHYFFGIYFKELLHKIKLLKLSSEIFHYVLQHRSLYGIESFLYFLTPSLLKTKLRIAEKGYLKKDFSDNHTDKNVIVDVLYNSKSVYEALINHFEYKLEHLLKWEDRNSMWFSLEARIPFLDYRLVERTLSMDSSSKIKNGMTKFLLRDSMKNVLPEKIRVRKDKIGFDTPEDDWFRTPKFISYINEILNSKSFAERGYINIKKAKELYSKHVNKKINISRDIWKWINTELWFREFID